MEDSVTENNTKASELPWEYTITFELVTEENEDDPALINTMGHEVVTMVQREGYITREQVYTGQKGGFLVEFVTTIQQIAIATWDNHIAIAEGISDLSGMITIFMAIVPMIRQMRQAYERQVGKEESIARPIKITVEIDQMPLVIESSDITQVDAALKLALKYHSVHPATATQVTTKSKVKVQGRVSARKRRQRR